MTNFTQSASITTLTTTPAITFDNDGDTWSLLPLPLPITISSLFGDAVVSTHNNNILINHTLSTISAPLHIGVYLAGNHGSIINLAGGAITGKIGAIFVNGDFETIDNSGVIGSLASTEGVRFWDDSNHVTLTNHAGGTIMGHEAGIAADSHHEGGHIVNEGSILSDTFGIVVAPTPGLRTVIDNSGTIGGDTASIQSILGAVYLNNTGVLSNKLDLSGGGADTILNNGQIAGPLFLGAGEDYFNGFQGNSGEVFGGAGQDRLIGSNHADLLNGGRGGDTLTGGKGADHFDFDAAADSRLGFLHDEITDFRHGQGDLIDLSGIDANATHPGDPSFVFRGTLGFNGAGQIRYVLHNLAGTAYDTTTIFGSVDADKAPEFKIEVKGLVHFVAGDFVL